MSILLATITQCYYCSAGLWGYLCLLSPSFSSPNWAQWPILHPKYLSTWSQHSYSHGSAWSPHGGSAELAGDELTDWYPCFQPVPCHFVPCRAANLTSLKQLGSRCVLFMDFQFFTTVTESSLFILYYPFPSYAAFHLPFDSSLLLLPTQLIYVHARDWAAREGQERNFIPLGWFCFLM